MPPSSMRYEPVPPNPPDASDPEIGVEGEEEEGSEGSGEENELAPLVRPDGAPGAPAPSRARHLLGGLFRQGRGGAAYGGSGIVPPVVTLAPATPVSSDGVFANIPAKPSSSRDRNKEDEDLGEDEWIFMTPEQRRKLAPPKYSKIKRDRAPQYVAEYTPPVLPPGGARKSRRARGLRPRVNALPAGSSSVFVAAAAAPALLPLLGLLLVHLAGRRRGGGRWRWRCHAARLGARAGFGLGLLHAGAMLLYVPALLRVGGGGGDGGAALRVPVLLGLTWLAVVALPFGGRLARDAAREYAWVKAQERVLVERIVQANLTVAPEGEDGDAEGEGDEGGAGHGREGEDVEAGRRYIQGTDLRVRDLKRILAKARDARLARSLRAAGF